MSDRKKEICEKHPRDQIDKWEAGGGLFYECLVCGATGGDGFDNWDDVADEQSLDETQQFEKRRALLGVLTTAEARIEAQALDLPDSVVQFICDQFDQFETISNDPRDHDVGRFGPAPGSYGRIAWRMSWESVFDDLADTMQRAGRTDDMEINLVFDTFFEE